MQEKRRILLKIEYRGTDFSGWQMQKDYRTVQGELERVLLEVCGHPVTLYGSGRTDKGVHAMGQTAHFDTTCSIPADRFSFPLNIALPADVKIRESKQVPPRFHARFDTERKTYVYRMYESIFERPLLHPYALQVYPSVDVEAMNLACTHLIGRQDFNAFKAEGNNTIKDTVRLITAARVDRLPGGELRFVITGKGFLYNMVRIIVGTLIEIGQGKHPPEYMREVIDSKNRLLAGKTVGAEGLYLWHVSYADGLGFEPDPL
ncbi:MAG: tRNA pseudouridine(38-40) synthase TruA [Clostridia bacterium]|nr:tRNA pseudouridine(38-40) synthase TruA [Clostridia bacterium]